jgi:hypothetical protein
MIFMQNDELLNKFEKVFNYYWKYSSEYYIIG